MYCHYARPYLTNTAVLALCDSPALQDRPQGHPLRLHTVFHRNLLLFCTHFYLVTAWIASAMWSTLVELTPAMEMRPSSVQ